MQELARPLDHTKTPQQRTALLDRWQENLAILLANRSKDGVVLGRLGDVLWSRYGCVEAAHVCYLAADHSFQSADNPNARLVLLGGDHKIRKRALFHAETLQRTEILEYSRKLANSQYSMPTLAPYKLLYAMQLADVGLLEQAYHYLQQLLPLAQGKAAASQPPVFVQQVNVFAHRLSHVSAGLSSALAKGGGWNPLSKLGSLVGRGIYAIIGDGEAEEDAAAAAASHAPMGGSIPPPDFVPPVSKAPARAQPAPVPVKAKEAPAPVPKAAPPKPVPAAKKPDEEKKQPAHKKEPEPKKKAASKGGKEEDEVSGGGGWGWGWFGRNKAKNPVHLGKRMDGIEYDNELKMYVKKGTKEPAFASAATRVAAPPTDAQLGAPPAATYAAPPPMMTASAGPPIGAPAYAAAVSAPPAGPALGMPGAPVATVSPPAAMTESQGSRFSRFANNKAGGGRSRYYDSMNEGGQAAPAPAVLAPAMLMPSTPAPSAAGAAPALFVPTPVDSAAASTYETPDFYAPPAPPVYQEEEPQAQAPPPSLAQHEPPALDNSWLDS